MLIYKPKLSHNIQCDQLLQIESILKNKTDLENIILCGDFNVPSGSENVTNLIKSLSIFF